MARVSHDDDTVQFRCPGCGRLHILNLDQSERPCWSFNGDDDRPTISPSINAWVEGPAGQIRSRCHSFVEAGRIRFLPDCMHELAGQTVDLPDLQPEA